MERSLTVTSTGGLANRLRVLCSGLVVAEATNRTFSMVWPVAGRDCAVGFHQLFSNDWPVIDSPEEHQSSAWDDDLPFNGVPNIAASTQGHLRVVHFASLITRHMIDHRELQRRADELFSRLQPQSHLQKRIDELSSGFDGFTIGAHVRRGDFNITEPQIVENLKPAIEEVQRQTALLSSDAPWTVFLATDDGASHHLGTGVENGPASGVRQKFRSEFGDHLRESVPRSLDRASPEAMEDALVDLWLLRQCDTVVGTSRSSFTEAAVIGRDAPLKQVRGPDNAKGPLERLFVRSGSYRFLGKIARRRLGYRPAPHHLGAWIWAEIRYGFSTPLRQIRRVRQKFG